MKIAYLSATSDIGGAEISLLNLIRGLDKTRFTPVAALPKEGRLSERMAAIGLSPDYMPMEVRRRRHPISFWRSQKAIAGWLKQQKPDILHVNSFWAPELAIPVAYRLGIPVIYHLRDFYESIDPVREAAFRKCAHLIAISNCVKDNVLSCVAGLPVSVIYNAVEPAELENANEDKSFREKYGWTDNPVIGTASRISPEKGQMTFLEAAAMIVKKLPEARFLVVGGSQFSLDGDFDSAIAKAVDQYGLRGKLEFTGFVDNVASVYKTMNVCVLASKREPFGRVVIEAMGCGTPIVATRSGGPEEVIIDKENGRLVDVDNPQAMASACIDMLRNPGETETLVKNALQTVYTRFTLANARQVEDLYTSVLSRSR